MKIKKLLYIILVPILVLFLTGCFNDGSLTIVIGNYEKHIYVGDKVYLTTNKEQLSSDEQVVWETSDEFVVTVTQDGLVEAVGEGVATVTAILGDYENIVIFYVTDEYAKPEIEITGPQQVVVKQTINLKATINNNSELIWETSNKTIATVDQGGLVEGITPGVVTIKVTSADDYNVYKEIIILVSSGNGIQDVVKNYIEKYSYVLDGNFDLTSLNNKVVNMVKSVEKSVIGIATYSNKAGTSLQSTGTGGIYKKETTSTGYKYTVFTNHHVIEGGEAIKVYLGDIDEYVFAKLVKSDDSLDIAILTFEHSSNYEVLQLGKVGGVNNGDFVVAIGNPGGFTYYGSVTFGMVSESTRTKSDSEAIYVQHDTPINPGNSGGPLFNLNGEVIGINTLKLASSTIEGMGFSIAAETFLEYLK